MSDEHPRQFHSMPEEAQQMGHTLQFGIGLHHAGLNDKDGPLVTRTTTFCNPFQECFQNFMPISVNGSRKLENDTMTNFGVDMMPLFVMDGVLPFQKFLLPIFEPRYRLMIFACTLSLKQRIRSIMEGNCRMETVD
ncbi:unnamed protein product [Prunus armeniaca]